MRATATSVRWPTTSRPRRIHDRLASSRRSPAEALSGSEPVPPTRSGSRPFGLARSGSPTRRWLEDDEERAGSPGERGQTSESFGEARGTLEPGGQVDDEQVDRSSLEECAGHRETLVEVGRSEDDEPLELDPASDGLDRVEAPIEVQPGDDRARGLGLGDETEGEGGPPG